MKDLVTIIKEKKKKKEEKWAMIQLLYNRHQIFILHFIIISVKFRIVDYKWQILVKKKIDRFSDNFKQ